MRACLILVLFSVCLADVLQLKLRRIESIREKLIKKGKWNEYVKRRDLLRNQNNETGGHLTDVANMRYVTEISVGTPPQKFVILPDTGSCSAWVPNIDCQGTCNSYTHTKFNSNSSSTFEQTEKKLNDSYGAGVVSGVYGLDNWLLGDGDQAILITNVSFGLAQSFNLYLPEDSEFDGIMGMVPYYDNDLDDKHEKSPLLQAYEEGKFDSPIFTVYLEPLSGPVNGSSKTPGGLITYGGFDHENCDSNINYVPIANGLYFNFYAFNVDGVSFGEYNSTDGPVVTVTDTGAPTITLKQDYADNIAQLAGANPTISGSSYTIDCNAQSNLTLVLKIGGIDYEITFSELILEQQSDGSCLFGIEGTTGNFQLFGDPFIRSVCHVHDLERKNMGFAKPKQN